MVSAAERLRSTREDTTKGTQVTVAYRYDAVGSKVFTSLPTGASCAAATNGMTYDIDVLGRITKSTHADGTLKKTEYLADYSTRETDEKGNQTTYFYQSYGEGEQYIYRIEAPEQVSTIIIRNKLGSPQFVWQGKFESGGFLRSYKYDSRFTLLLKLTLKLV